MLDLLIIGGSCPDYQLGKMVKRNIGIRDGRIVCLSAPEAPLPEAPLPEAAETIDAAGKVVSPGFIDIHMHEENFADEGPDYVIAQRMLEMGGAVCVQSVTSSSVPSTAAWRGTSILAARQAERTRVARRSVAA